MRVAVFFFNDTATTEIYTLSLHDALPILTGNPQAIIERYGPSYSGDGGYALRLNATGRLHVSTLATFDNRKPAFGSTKITTGGWHHAAGLLDRSQPLVYSAGQMERSQSCN